MAANKKITWWQKKHTFDTNKIKQRAIVKQTQKTVKMLGKIVPKRETTFENNSVPKKEGKIKGKVL